MNGSKRRPRISLLAGIAVGLLGALLIIPATRWIVRSDLGLALPFGDSRASMAYLGIREGIGQPDLDRAATVIERYAAERPNDYQAQLGAALTFLRPQEPGKNPDYAEAVRPLMAKFPENPSAYANYLRLMCMSRIRLKREESYQLEHNDEHPRADTQSKPISQEDLDRFNEAAAVGERLDPGNAYFPLMAAFGLYADHKDSEAVSALERGAQCTKWREYYDDQVYAQWRLAEEALADPSSITRTAISAAVLFPHLSQFRELSRIATYQAISLEKEGKYEEGLRIRHSLMRCSGLMRTYGQTLICGLVGNAMASIAASRPEGVQPIKADSKLSREQRKNLTLQPYAAYLHKIGHDDEAEWVKNEFAAELRMHEIAGKVVQTWDIIHELLTVLAWRLAGLLLLSSALLTLVMGGASAILGRTKWFKAGKPVSSGVFLGIFLASGLTILGFGVALGTASHAFWPLVIGGCLAIMVSFTCCGGRIGRTAALSFLATQGSLAVLALGGIWQIGGIAAIYKVALSLVATGGDGAPAPTDSIPVAILAYGAILGIPMIAIIGLAIFSKVCRVPASIGIVRGMRGLAIPIASVLILIYGATVIQTARKDGHLNYANERWVHHEGEFYAEMSGKEWPGLSW
jgi:hypothetical protein